MITHQYKFVTEKRVKILKGHKRVLNIAVVRFLKKCNSGILSQVLFPGEKFG